jgi:hypothetical protein
MDLFYYDRETKERQPHYLSMQKLIPDLTTAKYYQCLNLKHHLHWMTLCGKRNAAHTTEL